MQNTISNRLCHEYECDVNVLPKLVINVIEEIASECYLIWITISISNSPESSRQRNDIINDIAGSVTNGISMISSDDRTFHINLYWKIPI